MLGSLAPWLLGSLAPVEAFEIEYLRQVIWPRKQGILHILFRFHRTGHAGFFHVTQHRCKGNLWLVNGELYWSKLSVELHCVLRLLSTWNFVTFQMRSSVNFKSFIIKKHIDNFLHWLMPNTFIPKYTMASEVKFSVTVHKISWVTAEVDLAGWAGAQRCIHIGIEKILFFPPLTNLSYGIQGGATCSHSSLI